MDYEKQVVHSFAARTRTNLKFIEDQQRQGAEAYEVTQLINSLLGLLVFPQQYFFESIPEVPLADLEARGWPPIEFISGKSECQTLKDLVRFLRNGVAHFNIRFEPDHDGQIEALKIWNYSRGSKTWEARLTIDQLRKIVDVFIDSLQGA